MFRLSQFIRNFTFTLEKWISSVMNNDADMNHNQWSVHSNTESNTTNTESLIVLPRILASQSEFHSYKPPSHPVVFLSKLLTPLSFDNLYPKILTDTKARDSLSPLQYYIQFQNDYFDKSLSYEIPQRLLNIHVHNPDGAVNLEFESPDLPANSPILSQCHQFDNFHIGRKNYFQIIQNGRHITPSDIPYLIQMISDKSAFSLVLSMEADTLDQNYLNNNSNNPHKITGIVSKQPEDEEEDIQKAQTYVNSLQYVKSESKESGSSTPQMSNHNESVPIAKVYSFGAQKHLHNVVDHAVGRAELSLCILKHCFSREELMPYSTLLINKIVPLLCFPNNSRFFYYDMIVEILVRIMSHHLIKFIHGMLEMVKPVPDIIDTPVDLRCYLIEVLGRCSRPESVFSWSRKFRRGVIPLLNTRLQSASKTGLDYNYFTTKNLNFAIIMALANLGALVSSQYIISYCFSKDSILVQSDRTPQTIGIVKALLVRQSQRYSGESIIYPTNVVRAVSNLNQLIIGTDYTWEEFIQFWIESKGCIVSSNFPFTQTRDAKNIS